MKYWHSYPTKPIGGGNPYYCCSKCGVSDPQINGKLSGHRKNCSWRRRIVEEYLLKRAKREVIIF